jgi:hypothetical protein
MWRLALPFLETPLRPIDVICLNMALFLTMLALVSLSRQAAAPRRLSGVDWRDEFIGMIGTFIAIAIIFAAGFGAVIASMEGETYQKLLAVAAAAPEGPAKDQAALALLAKFSAFYPVADGLAQALGVAAGSALDRTSASIKMLMGFSFLLIVMTSFAIWTSRWLLGYRGDIRRTALRVWRFNLAVALVLVLSGVSVYCSQICEFPSSPLVMTLCKKS